MNNQVDHEARERIVALETGLKSHLISCTMNHSENKEAHAEMKDAVQGMSDEFKRDIRQLFSRIWWMVGVIITGCASIVLTIYKAME